MRKFWPLIIFVMMCFCGINYNNYLVAMRSNNDLNSKKDEYKNLVLTIDTYKKYEASYLLVFDESKSLEEKLAEIEKDINTKSERVDYYKSNISKLSKVVG